MQNQWQAEKYDHAMGYVTQFGGELLDLLVPKSGERIADWGCGTGDLASRIASKGADVTGIDGSAEMIERARAKYPKLTFLVADGQLYRQEQAYDAVFSNAALHWMTDANSTAEGISCSLRPGGRLVAEFGGHGNIALVIEALKAAFKQIGQEESLLLPWYFPTVGQYASLLEKHGLFVNAAVCFDRPTKQEGGENGLALWLDAFAGGILSQLDEQRRSDVISIMHVCLYPKLFRDGEWILDYRRLRIIAIKQ
ncbi:class I SAM-dependent methyltransferase [Paenibacillus abyssi]|uniref:Methyltransferase type 11 n=1 Tax=Paenibacillus abyssi TaxID=1340531 RepID=A0A917FS19_9BACL|nr:methyltransferase domain-containing protein [Paenibacillus abyssi]GGF97366.1 methyltransferase type 11 [Paenibacillus abyssi]